MITSILIIEDEVELAEVLGEYLKTEGFHVFLADDGEKGIQSFKINSPNMVILDIMLPKIDGIQVCKKIREESDVPILMLSAKSGEMDKVICLGAGADDYVTKPFSPLELVARVKAHMRRYAPRNKAVLTAGDLVLYKESYEAITQGKKLELTTKEFDVLYFLAGHLNIVFSKEQIYENVWGMNEFGDISSVAVYIKRIRTKLMECGIDYIRTVWGAGYKMSV